MNPTQLRDALSANDADPGTVLARLHAKQRTRRRRRVLGVLAAVAVVAGGAMASPVFRAAPGAGGAKLPAAAGPSAGGDPGAAFAAGGACLTLAESISRVPADGVSLITAHSTRTGRTALDGYRYHEMALTQVRTLAGPPVKDGSTAWTLVPEATTSRPEVAEGGPDAPLWGPNGAFLGFYAPQSVNKGPLGATVVFVPLVQDKVIMASSGCWNSFSTAGLTGTPFRGPLDEVPGSGAYARLARQGFTAVPLREIEDLAKK